MKLKEPSFIDPHIICGAVINHCYGDSGIQKMMEERIKLIPLQKSDRYLNPCSQSALATSPPA